MEEEKNNLANNGLNRKERFLDALKFYLIPCWRDPENTKKEFEFGKTKSKRKIFGKFLTPLTITGFCLILFIVVLAIFSPWLTPYTLENLSIDLNIGSFDPPSPGHPLGQTKNGWDILGRLIWGARTALIVGFSSTLIAVVFGVIIGVISAYFGGLLDSFIMRIMDIIIAIPSMILALILVTLFGIKLHIILIALSALGIPGYARFIRASVLQEKQNIYVEAAKTAGANDFKIMFSVILPNCLSPLIIAISFSIGITILSLSGISYLGFSDPRFIDWGTDIIVGKGKFINAPWISLWPGLFIGIAVLGFMLLGDGLRDAIDPKQLKG